MSRERTEGPSEEQLRAEEEIAILTGAAYDVAPAAAGDSPTECDVIMKGGIASGVVYPLTICKLATRYRLRSIGGTSAGAIAAVMAAAAEYRRRHDPVAPAAGFRALAQLPNDVATRLLSLFQAPPATRPVFGVLLTAMERGKVAGVIAVVRQKIGWFLAGLLLVLAVALPGLLAAASPHDGDDLWPVLGGLALPALLGVVVGLVLAVVGFVRSALEVLPAHDFGLTDGATHESEPALTEWLAGEIDRVAGVGPDRCLTLGDLWGERALVAWREHQAKGSDPVGEAKRLRDIDLETMTTDLTLRRPFRLPFSQQVFLFDREEMLALFPERVVDTMVGGRQPSKHVNAATGKPLWPFPGPAALPVVVMARMSLSFPGLISAVPLHAVDFNGDQSVVRHLFSDGGISSNFPMHFFDSLLPSRPTFGINLSTPHPLHPDQMTWLPEPASGGILPRATPVRSLVGFAQALRDTIQNWSDNTQVTQRGYAERVVEIRLGAGEGGMNLARPPELIYTLVARGAEAGDKLLTFQWDPHRIIRYRTAMVRLTEALESVGTAWTTRDYAGLHAAYPSSGAPASSYVAGKAWREDDLAATEALLATVEAWRADAWPALREDRPSPAPAIRMAPE